MTKRKLIRRILREMVMTDYNERKSFWLKKFWMQNSELLNQENYESASRLYDKRGFDGGE